ncbi:energy-coupling factor ABC transporter ATP-binding protein [Nicoliella spurrieriana]|uniref:Energy-coupling factor ABC transporter ATP-binding protein n=1 Tax=Nicoliella spurrieriana TaxID=2925830 RepID=A0A976X556_9LACO|nr:ABC transporter ATP-binding protein [Nicoliella spurrieriana]UQS86281.1 energy-coupling factor ABC transporter ATP-binding protein [Nicoliella spurrieriana]
MAAVTVSHFTFTYQNSAHPVLADVNLTFTDAHISLIAGPSGTGKSTLLKSIAGLYPEFANGEYTGTIKIGPKPLAEIQPTALSGVVSMMFQNPNQQFTMTTVNDELQFALENRQVDPEVIPERIDAALQFVNIQKLKHRHLNALSGGEKQKVALAIIIAMDSDVILLDEPFASLDRTSRADLLHQLVRLRDQRGKTIILVDHDLSGYQDVVDDFFYLEAHQYQIQKLTNAQVEQLLVPFDHADLKAVKLALPTPNEQAALNLTDCEIKQGQATLLRAPQFQFYAHRVTLITGENGIGKSTLFKAMTRLFKYQGLIAYHGQDIQKLRKKKYLANVALVFQDAEMQFIDITMEEELALSVKNASNHHYTQDDINAMLTALHLDGHEQQVVYTLSEGQKKKLQIIEMLIMGTDVLLMDEPFKGLDINSLAVIVQMLQTASQRFHQTIIIISHQLSGLETLFDYHVEFKNQQLTYRGALL